MALTHEEIEHLKREIKDELMPLFVTKDDCSDVQSSVTDKLSNDDKRIELMGHDFAVIKKLIWVVASSSIGALVVEFFELILK